MEISLAGRPWRFVARMLEHGWHLEETSCINAGLFNLIKFGEHPQRVRQISVATNFGARRFSVLIW